MRTTAVVACVSLFAGALSAQTSSSAVLQGGGEQGVTVMVLPPSPQTHEPLRYVLSEPAYVAAFVVYPGAGVRLLSPSVNVAERVRRGGYNTEQLIGVSFDNDIYRAVLGPELPGPAYLYVIASRHPLDVARYVHKPLSLASAIGERESRSFYTDVAFDALLNNAVNLGDDSSWDSDMFMLWPGSESSAGLAGGIAQNDLPSARYTSILCADGTSRVVPINYPFIGCPGHAHIRPRTEAVQPVQQVQQSASASPMISAPSLGGEAASGATAEHTTVLPTIIGTRDVRAEQRSAIQREAVAQRATYTTVANGDQQAPVEPTEQPVQTQTQVQVIDAFQGRSPDRARAEREALHNRYSPERAERMENRPGRTRQDAGMVGPARGPDRVAPSPRLSPNPELAPTPRMAPAPGLTPAPRAAPAPGMAPSPAMQRPVGADPARARPTQDHQ
jgi:hypothetical protein